MNISPISPSLPRSLKSLPGPPSLPVVGNSLALRPATLHLTLEDWARRYGDAYRFHLGPRPVLVVSHPDVARKVMVDRPDTFRRMSKLAQVMQELNMLGVFAAEGEDWRRQRKLLNPGFQSAHLQTFFPSLATITQRLHRVLDSTAQTASPVDILPLLMRYTVDVTTVVSFGKDLDTLQNGPDSLQRHIDYIFPAIQQRLLAPFPYWRLLPSARATERAMSEARQVLQGFIDSARATLEREPERAEHPRTLLEAMLAARDEEHGGSRLTDDEIFANVLTLLLGGEDTTANTLGWILYYAASMPEVQARARMEVDAVLGEEALPSLTHLKSLHYVTGMAQEALRLRSPTPLLYLESLHDTVVGDVAVPAGTMVITLSRLLCLNKSLFGDPERYRPERWLSTPPPETLPHTPRMMMAFGAGGRVCPGRNLAMLQCALAIGMVLRHFEVELANPDVPVRELNVFSVQPHGVRLRFKRRASAGGAAKPAA